MSERTTRIIGFILTVATAVAVGYIVAWNGPLIGSFFAELPNVFLMLFVVVAILAIVVSFLRPAKTKKGQAFRMIVLVVGLLVFAYNIDAIRPIIDGTPWLLLLAIAIGIGLIVVLFALTINGRLRATKKTVVESTPS